MCNISQIKGQRSHIIQVGINDSILIELNKLSNNEDCNKKYFIKN